MKTFCSSPAIPFRLRNVWREGYGECNSQLAPSGTACAWAPPDVITACSCSIPAWMGPRRAAGTACSERSFLFGSEEEKTTNPQLLEQKNKGENAKSRIPAALLEERRGLFVWGWRGHGT